MGKGAVCPSPAIWRVSLLGDSHVLPDSSSLEPHCVTAFSLVDGYGSPTSMALYDTALCTYLGGRPREGWPKCRLGSVAVTQLCLLPPLE